MISVLFTILTSVNTYTKNFVCCKQIKGKGIACFSYAWWDFKTVFTEVKMAKILDFTNWVIHCRLFLKHNISNVNYLNIAHGNRSLLLLLN